MAPSSPSSPSAAAAPSGEVEESSDWQVVVGKKGKNSGGSQGFSPAARDGAAGASSGGDAAPQEDVPTQKVEVAVLRHHLKEAKKEIEQLRAQLAAAESRAKPDASASASAAADLAEQLKKLEIAEPVKWPPEPDQRDKRRLLDHLRSEVYVSLGASRVAGVGVFALRPIPKGVNPFQIVNDHLALKEQFCVCNAAELKDISLEVKEQLFSFFAPLTEADDWLPQKNKKGDILYGILCTGLNSLNVSWYLNHSDTPNVEFKDAESDGEFNTYVTKVPIARGEELLVDYRSLGREYHALVTGGS